MPTNVKPALRIIDLIYFSALLILILGTVDYISGLAASGDLFAFVRGGSYSFSDFVHYYQAGQITLSEDHNRIYDPAVQLAWFNKLFPNYHWDKPHFIQYAPFVFPLSAPLALMPMKEAFMVWLAFSLTLSAVSLEFLASRLSSLSKAQTGFLYLGALASWVSVFSIHIGQPSWIIVGLAALYFSGLAQGSNVSGVALALTSFKPHYAIFLAVPALMLKRWKLIAIAAVTEVVLLLLACFTVGWQNVVGYPAMLMHADTTGSYLGVHPEKMACVRGLLSLVLPQSTALAASLVIMIACLAATAFVWWKTDRRIKQATNLALSFTVLLCLIASPHTHLYDYLLLAVPAVLLLPAAGLATILGERKGELRLLCLILYAYPLVSWAVQFVPATGPLAQLNAIFLLDAVHATMLMLMCLAIARLPRTTESENSDTSHASPTPP